MPRNHLDLVPTAARSLQTILDIADHVSAGSLRGEVAATVRGLFDLLAWSDGDLSLQELTVLDRLCEAVPGFDELCGDHDHYSPTDPTFGEIPRLLTAVVEHDRHTGERLASVLVASLETMGYAMIGAGGAPSGVQKAELRTYVDSLRDLSQVLTRAPAFVLL